MKTVVAALNAHYIHVSLAVYKLEKYCKDIVVREFTINQEISRIYAELYREAADIYGFSCYIWNVDMCLRLASMLKKARPNCKIVFGGPEAGASPHEFLTNNEDVDFCISGAGEKPLAALLEGKEPCGICGLYYRENGQIYGTPAEKAFDMLPMPYTDKQLDDFGPRIVYYEASRGCPFKCTYCMSGSENLINYPTDKVKAELSHIAECGVPLVKLVDRTFNADRKRAYELFDYLMNNTGNTRFHFEVAADLFDEKTLTLLKDAPKGKFQFETGIQSTNEKTLAAIDRHTNLKRATENIKTILGFGNIHIHVDLIAGLPYEGFERFAQSFNECMSLRPDMLQLGFLKLLPGTPIRRQAEKYGYAYQSFAPYEVIANDFICADELIEAHKAADAVDKFYNSGAFSRTMTGILNGCEDAFSLFLQLGEKIEPGMSQNTLYQILFDRFGEQIRLSLCTDFLQNGGKRLPDWAKRQEMPGFSAKCFEFLRRYKDELFPEYKNTSITRAMQLVRIEAIDGAVLLTDRNTKTVKDVTELWRAF